jgi:hypothetical protein
MPTSLEDSASPVDLSEKLRALQDRLATIDLLSEPSSSEYMKLLLKKHKKIALRMDIDSKHARAHIHVDYGASYHMASYAIDNAEKLAGTDKYKAAIQEWISENRSSLMNVWNITRSSGQPQEIIAQLKASEFG